MSRLGLVSAKNYNVSVSSQEADVAVLSQLFLSLSEQGVYAESRLHVIAPYKLIVCIIIIIIINGCENKVMTAITITCSSRPILTFW